MFNKSCINNSWILNFIDRMFNFITNRNDKIKRNKRRNTSIRIKRNMRRNTSIRRQSIFNLCKINICNNKLNMSKWMQWKNDTHKKKSIYVVCLAQFQFLNNIIVKQITKKKFKKTCDKIAFERCKSKTSLSVAHFYMVVTLSCSFNFKENPNSLKKNIFDNKWIKSYSRQNMNYARWNECNYKRIHHQIVI